MTKGSFNLAEWALRHRQIIYYFIAILFFFGIFSFFKMGRMEDPNFTIRTMVVAAAWPGASPEQMSEQVTHKLEEKLRDLPGIDYTASFTDGEKTVIYVNLKEDIPDSKVRPTWLEARNMIRDEWSHLPKGVQGPVINDRFDDVYGNVYALTGQGFTPEEQRRYADEIKRELLTVPNVKSVILKGVQQQTVYVEMDKDKLASYRMSGQDVLKALQQQSAMVPSGTVSTDTTKVYIRVNGLFDSVQAIRELPLQVRGATMRLGDFAKVELRYSDPKQPSFSFNGDKGIGIAVSMEPGANNIEFGKALDAKIKSIEKQLPVGLSIHQVSNQPAVVKSAISEFTRSLFEAIVIVLAVSFFSLGMRSGVVVALTIPVVVATTFVAMYADGIDLHKVSLGALIISLGLLVDDAIIVIEMMQVKFEEGMDRFNAAAYAYKATAYPMLSGTLITCAGFLPIFLSKGMVAEFTHSLFIVVTMALLISWLASVLVSPVLGYRIIEVEPPNPNSKKERLRKWGYDHFQTILEWALGHKKTVLGITIAAFVVSMATTPLIKQQFFPAATRPELIVSAQFPQSSSQHFTEQQAKVLDDMLKGDKRIEHFATYVGEGSPRFVLTFDPQMKRSNLMQTIITAKSVDDRNALYAELSQKLKDTFPSALVNLSYIQTGPPSEYPLMFRVAGPDPKKVAEIAETVRKEMQRTPQVSDVDFDWPDSEPVARVHIDPVKARMLGIDSYAIALDLQSKVSGMKVGEYYEGTQTIPIHFKLGGDEQHSLKEIESIPIQTASGTYVPLSQVATISLSQEEGIIWHRNMIPTITVHGSVPPTALSNAIEKEIYDKLASVRKNLPEGYSINMGGSSEKSVTALNNLKAPIPIMIVVIMTILMFQLKRIPLMIMALLTAPLGLIGVVLTMVITRTPMGFMSVLGIIALSGMIIRNSIILIDQIETHRREGQSVYDAIVSSTLLRFRPILLTALAAILGMVPLMTNVFWAPLAIAFSGGLLVATILTLLVVPVMYGLVYGRSGSLTTEDE